MRDLPALGGVAQAGGAVILMNNTANAGVFAVCDGESRPVLGSAGEPRSFCRGRRVAAAAVFTAQEFQIAKVYQQTCGLPGNINWIFAVERVDQQ
jgi:hypothetical protein